MERGGRDRNGALDVTRKLERTPELEQSIAANDGPDAPGLVTREMELESLEKARAEARALALKEAQEEADGLTEIGAEDLEELEEDGRPWLESDNFANEVSGGLGQTREFTALGSQDNIPTETDVLVDPSADLHHQPGWDVGDVVDDPADLMQTRQVKRQEKVVAPASSPIESGAPAIGIDVHLDLREAIALAQAEQDKERGGIARPDGVRVHLQEHAVESVQELRDSLTAESLEKNGPVEVAIGGTWDENGVLVPTAYEVIRKLGAGGMGEAFLARKKGEEGSDFVVKIHREAWRSSEKKAEGVAAKETVAGYGTHTDLAQGAQKLVDAKGDQLILTAMKKADGNDGDLYFKQMEDINKLKTGDHPYETAEEIQESIDARKEALERIDLAETPEGVQRAAETFLSLLTQLEAMHAMGEAHRDVKPANVVVAEKGLESTLIDYGISDQVLTKDLVGLRSDAGDVVKGSPFVMLPDLFTGNAEQSLNGDIYSAALPLELMMGFVEAKPFANVLIFQFMSASGQGYEAPDMSTPEGRAEFVEQHGGGLKLKLYMLLDSITKLSDNKDERHESWKQAGLTYTEDEELFEDASYSGDVSTKFNGVLLSKDGESISDQVALPTGSIDKTDMLNVTRIRHRAEQLVKEARGVVTGEYTAFDPEAEKRWIDTGEWKKVA